MLRHITPWFAILLLAQSLAAEVTLAPLFQTGGVLQRDKPLPVWGRATPGKTVTVAFAGETQTTTADATGRWKITLPSMQASAEGRTLTATETGLPALEVKDLLVGEVWLASGQSNMQWSIKQVRQEDQAIAAKGPVPLLRLFQVPLVVSNFRQETVDAKWTPATPETAKDFSAIGE